MSEQATIPETETPTNNNRRGKPEKPKRQSRSWMAEAHEREKERDALQARVNIALKVLRRLAERETGNVVVETAIDILSGEA